MHSHSLMTNFLHLDSDPPGVQVLAEIITGYIPVTEITWVHNFKVQYLYIYNIMCVCVYIHIIILMQNFYRVNSNVFGDVGTEILARALCVNSTVEYIE